MKLICCLVLSTTCILGGDLSSRFELTLHRISSGISPQFNDEFILADAVPQNTRRFTNFSGDVSGRYIGAMAMAAQYGGAENRDLDRIVSKVLALQKPDGHFGDPLSDGKVQNSDMATLWGNGRLLIGLLEYYRYRPRPEVLASAKKLGDFLVTIGPLLNSDAVRREYNGEKFAVGYICWTQNLEGLAELYRVTREDRYLALAREIAERTERHASQHSHGFLTTLRGMVDLYRVTGDRQYLARAEAEWKGVFQSGNVLVQGGVPEMFAPQIKRDEGCSEADWLRLGLDLWKETRNPEYLKQAEFTLFNEFSFNQFHTGDFGHHTLTGWGIAAPSARAWWCCTFHGLRAMAALFASVFHESERVVYYDLPVDGRVTAEGLTLQADSRLGQNGTVRLNVRAADGKRRTVAVRVPEWTAGVTVSVAGRNAEGPVRNGYLELQREWKAGEAVTIRYAMQTRLLKPEKPAPRVAVVYGPWLLAVDEAESPHYFDEPAIQNQVLLPAASAIELVKAKMTTEHGAAERAAGRFEAPVAHFELRYLPGGYPVQPGIAVLRPMAEFTGGPDSNQLDFWLPVKPQVEKLDSNYKP